MARAGFLRSWWFIVPAAAALAVGLYALAGFWLAPKLIRSLATEYAATELNKPLSLGEIRVNPFTFRLDIGDIRIDDGGKPLVALKHLFVDFEASSLWRGGYVFDSVRLDAPYARAIIRPDGSLNLVDLVPESDEPDKPLPEIFIGVLDVGDGRVDFADQSRSAKPEKTLSPIEFRLEDFRTTSEGGGFRLTAASERDERFEWSGHLSLQPFASDGHVAVGALQAGTLQAFVGDELPFELTSGVIDLATDYRFSAARGVDMQLDATLPRIVATQLGLRARGEDADWVTIPSAVGENARLSLAKREIAVETVRAEGVQATLWLDADGTVNLARMLAAPVPPENPGADSAAPSAVAVSADGGWTFALSRFELGDGNVQLQDRTMKPAADFRLSPLAVTASDLSLDLANPVPVSVETTVNGVAPMSVSGTVVPGTMAAALDVDLARLPLLDVRAYLPPYPTLAIESGEVAGKGRLTLRPDGEPGPGIEFAGDGSLSGFAMVEAESRSPLLSWQRVNANGLRYTSGPDALSIRALGVHRPYARVVVLPDQTINLLNALATDAPASKVPSSQADMSIRVDKVVLDAGKMSFSDLSIDPNFGADIEALRGTILGVSTVADSVAKVDLKGHVINRHSPVEITGETNVSAFDKHTDIRMAFSNIELPIFNPYSGRFAGYAIAKGKLSTELHYKIDDRALVADHHVVLDQLEWGDATDSKDKVSLPIRLATSLLKDRHGVIDLELPVTGTLDDPTFRIGPIVWQVLKNIVVKVATAPFSFIGSLFAGAEDAQFVDFAPGSADLTEKARGNLAALAAALSEKDELKLDIPAASAAETDADALREQRFHAALAAIGGVDASAFDYEALEAGDKLDLLKDLYKQQAGSRAKPPDMPESTDEATRAEKRDARDAFEIAWLEEQLEPRYAAGEAELVALGQARATAIQEALLAGDKLDATRVFLASNLAATVHEGAVRMELQLK